MQQILQKGFVTKIIRKMLLFMFEKEEQLEIFGEFINRIDNWKFYINWKEHTQ